MTDFYPHAQRCSKLDASTADAQNSQPKPDGHVAEAKETVYCIESESTYRVDVSHERAHNLPISSGA